MWIKISGKKMLFSSVRLIFICTLKTHTHKHKARDNFWKSWGNSEACVEMSFQVTTVPFKCSGK